MLDPSKVKEMLQQDGYFDAVKLIELLEGSINRKAEFLYLKAFARESSFDNATSVPVDNVLLPPRTDSRHGGV